MQTVTPYLLYEDCDAALDFLSRAFGFAEVLRYTGKGGYVNHAEMKVGEKGRIFLGDPGDDYENPTRIGHETVGIRGRRGRRRAVRAGARRRRGDQRGADRPGVRGTPLHGEGSRGARLVLGRRIKQVARGEWGAELR